MDNLFFIFLISVFIVVIVPLLVAGYIYTKNFGRTFEKIAVDSKLLDEYSGLKLDKRSFKSNKDQALAGFLYSGEYDKPKGIVVLAHGYGTGTVHITEDVIASIASYEASNIDGVVNMSASITSGVVERISGKNPNKGITVNIEDANVYVNMRIIVEYGKNIIEICNNIQNRVKETIESMTNLNVVEVNITVDSVVIVKENREKTQ